MLYLIFTSTFSLRHTRVNEVCDRRFRFFENDDRIFTLILKRFSLKIPQCDIFLLNILY